MTDVVITNLHVCCINYDYQVKDLEMTSASPKPQRYLVVTLCMKCIWPDEVFWNINYNIVVYISVLAMQETILR